ncbi:unnamed protein product [Pieris macdunnoughi]|uniref:RNase H type-1 domain-containing protein n=1 Tax=Pieris macdunnoughi TaxID=345717 RepID=A0A821LAQ6_9NEOP|nr:unnamed protein product [Pieris macdunnoughi]
MKLTKCLRLPITCSIFTAEAWAILAALTYVNSNVNNVNILVVSDSKSVLTALGNCSLGYKQNYIVYKIKDLLYKLEKHVEFVWVPSHSGITSNEVVDEATRRDHDDDLTDSFKVPFTDYYTQIKIHLKRRWKEYWNYNTEILNKGQWYSEIQRDLPMIPWYNSFKYINRKFV